MKICSDGHIEICWEEGRICPLCEVKEGLKAMEQTLLEMQEDVE